MQTLLLQYSESCFQSLANSLKMASEDYSIGVVHNLRLSIKKIRALLEVVGFRDDALKGVQILKKIDSLFLHSGHLRDIHVQTILLESYRIQVGEEVDFIIAGIKKEKKKINKQLQNRIRRINPFDIVLLNQRLDNTIESIDSNTLESHCRLKIDQLLDQIIQIISDIPDENMLHRIRILLKELIYTYSIIKKGRLKINFDAEFIKKLNNLQQKLGYWHDLKVLFDRIAKVDNHNEKLSRLLRRVNSDKSAFHAEIIDSLSQVAIIKAK